MAASLGAITYTAVSWTTGDVITEAKMDNMVANEQAYDSHAAQGVLLNNNKSFAGKNAAGNANLNLIKLGSDDKVVIGDGNTDVLKASTIVIQVFDGGDNTATGDGKAYFQVPPELAGMNLVEVRARVVTAGTTNTTDIQIANVTDSVDMLSTKMTIDSTEVDTSTAATPAVIDTTKDDVVEGDVLRIDIDAVSTTPAKGLVVSLRFALP